MLKIVLHFLFIMLLFCTPVFALEPSINLDLGIYNFELPGIGETPIVVPPIPIVEICPPGKIWVWVDLNVPNQSGQWVCLECPEGTYNETENLYSEQIVSTVNGLPVTMGWTSCPKCSDLSAQVTHTCTGTGACHDEKNDCYATVTFHGNGGLSSEGHEDEIVEAYYRPFENEYYSTHPESCYLNASIALCTRKYSDTITNAYGEAVGTYKITDGVTVDTQWSKNGYQFAGWYKNADLSDPDGGVYDYTANGGPTNAIFRGDIDLYAAWVCEAGYYLDSDGTTCKPCEAGYFCNGGVKAKCDDVNNARGCYVHSHEKAENWTDCYSYLYLVTADDTEHPSSVQAWADDINDDESFSCILQSYKTCQVSFASGYNLIESFVKEAKIYTTVDSETIVGLDYGPSDVEETNLVFVGWYTDPEFNEKVKKDTKFCGDKTLYQKVGCKKGYYGNLTDGCTKCPDGYTTFGVDVETVDGCKPAFQYGTDKKIWTWPDNITPGTLNTANITGWSEQTSE